VHHQKKSLSTAPRLTRYTARRAGRLLRVALALVLLGAPPSTLRAAEEPLSPEFLEYLGTVESSGFKGLDSMSLEEFYQMLKSALHKAVAPKDKDQAKDKDDHGKEKGSEHGDEPKH